MDCYITFFYGVIIMKKILKFLLFLILVFGVAGISYQVYSNVRHNAKITNVNKNKKVSFVALGDSLTQGVGDPKKTGGYVSRTKQALNKKGYKHVTTFNYGIAGQRSDQIDKRVQNNVKGLSSSLKKANIIVLTVGGNDLLQSLQSNALVDGKDKFNSRMKQASITYQAKVNKLMNDIRKENKKAPIYVFGIYNPIYVYFANVNVINQYVDKYNQITSGVVLRNKKAHFVGITPLSYGQYKSKAQKEKLVESSDEVSFNPLDILKLDDAKGELNNYISPDDHFHPNNKGYNYMTDRLVSQLFKYNDWN
ncbi:SGNH superfamily hydrolase [Apilactobacillus kunkeei]|nr:SGNH superfamily hydrolase [Apilactobacillus kunkeei]